MSVSRTTSSVSNEWFTPAPVKSGYKGKGRRHYSRRPRRSAEEQARHDAAKAEHVAASAAADDGEWVVKGKRHNKFEDKEPTPEEKAEAARLQQLKDLKAIKKTISGSMSVIRERKRNKVNSKKHDGKAAKNPKIVLGEKKKRSFANSFSLLAVDSTDDEGDNNVETFEVKPQEFPTLGTSVETKAPSAIGYSFALKSGPKKKIEPKDFPSPPNTPVCLANFVPHDFSSPKKRVCWGDYLDDVEMSDEEDDLPIPPEMYDFN